MDESVNREGDVIENKSDNVDDGENQRLECLHTSKPNLIAPTGHDVIGCSSSATLEKRRNLPGFHTTQVDMSEQHMEPPKAKKIKLSPGHASSGTFESGDNQEIGKRKRIQHDYRRLSSSGYLDDYETSRERRFSSDSDTSPNSNKLKTLPNMASDHNETEELPPVKLTLKLSKTESGTFINGSGMYQTLF